LRHVRTCDPALRLQHSDLPDCDPGDKRTGLYVLVVRHRDLDNVAANLGRQRELARVDESVVGGLEMPRVQLPDDAGDNGHEEGDGRNAHSERMSSDKPESHTRF